MTAHGLGVIARLPKSAVNTKPTSDKEGAHSPWTKLTMLCRTTELSISASDYNNATAAALAVGQLLCMVMCCVLVCACTSSQPIFTYPMALYLVDRSQLSKVTDSSY